MQHIKAVILATLCTLPLIFTGCSKAENNKPSLPAKEKQQRVPAVKVLEVLPTEFIKKIEVLGVCKAKTTSTISTEESGVIREIHFDKGDIVNKGKLLLRIDDTLLQATLKELEASHEMARLNHEKLEALKKGRGAVTDFDLRTAALRMDISAAKVENVRAQLEKKSIISPLGGIIEKKHVEKGEFISPGMPVASIIDISRVKVEAAIAEKDLSYFRKGVEAEIFFNAYPGETFKGKVDYISPDVDRKAGTFSIEINLDNRKKRFKPGMMARVRLVKERCGGCLIIPQDAVMDGEKGLFLFVVTSDGTAVRRTIELGETEDSRVVVASGLVAGERIVMVGQHDLVDGEKVEISE
ncbi:MAG: efflux RND transporter periplasmic adaptor subunit [bacterium]|nr:efflux RND transporter periplasmic adaptor subunit [bacterium]